MQKLTKAQFMAKVMDDRRRRYREQMEAYKEREVEEYLGNRYSKYGKYNRYFRYS